MVLLLVSDMANMYQYRTNMPNRSEEEKHRRSLLCILNALRLKEKLCDVTITVENRQFRAHKNILSASSDYFHSMFTSGFQEKNQDEISFELEGKSTSFAGC